VRSGLKESTMVLVSLTTAIDLHGMAPRYHTRCKLIQPAAEVTSRRRLQSASSSALVVPATRRSSLLDRAFVVAGPRAWNGLAEFVTADCSSPLTFKKFLFRARIRLLTVLKRRSSTPL